MPPTELVQALRRRPFVPFRLHVSGGTTYDIRHPELLIVSFASAVVGLPAAGATFPQVERYEIVDLTHVIRVEPLEATTKASDGAA